MSKLIVLSIQLLGTIIVYKLLLYSTNTLGKGMNPIILPPAMGK